MFFFFLQNTVQTSIYSIANRQKNKKKLQHMFTENV